MSCGESPTRHVLPKSLSRRGSTLTDPCQAIDFAQEAFPELKYVDRSLICLEVSVLTGMNGSNESKAVRIDKRAWRGVVATLRRVEIVLIHVASSLLAFGTVISPALCAPEAGRSSDMEGVAQGPQLTQATRFIFAIALTLLHGPRCRFFSYWYRS
jgi:hypothetical protein